MKSLRVHEIERVVRLRISREQNADRRHNDLKQTENILPYSPEQDKRRDDMRLRHQNGQTEWIGIACDHCGTELVNRDPGLMLASSPPQIRIGCFGCGWIGNTYV